MKEVSKYNLFKSISAICTFGTPIVTLLCCGDFIVETPGKSISGAGVFSLLLVLFFAKDKLAENYKIPSPFVLCLVIFILITMVEKIMLPVKIMCITTMIATGIDEMTFKRIYKSIKLPDCAEDFKHFGFIFATTEKLKSRS